MSPLPCFALFVLLAGAVTPPPGAPPTGLARVQETGKTAQIRFTYRNPQLQPAKYVLLLKEDGDGYYRSETGSGKAAGAGALPAQEVDRQIRVSKAASKKIFLAARRGKYFDMPCEAKGDKVAFQGTKILEYSGAEGHGSCTYNWTKDNNIQYITETFEGISLTLEEGAKLEIEHQYARLSLDSELETLEELAERGEALEIENIVPVLKAIASDDAVLKRAQSKARSLLTIAGANETQN